MRYASRTKMTKRGRHCLIIRNAKNKLLSETQRKADAMELEINSQESESDLRGRLKLATDEKDEIEKVLSDFVKENAGKKKQIDYELSFYNSNLRVYQEVKKVGIVREVSNA